MKSSRGLAALTGILVVPAGICAIVNYSINHTLTWAWFPIGGLVLVWAMTAPLLFLQKNRGWGVWAGSALTLIPFLYLVQYLVNGHDWFMGLALPIAGLFLAIFALCILPFSIFKKDPLFAVAISILLFGVLGNYLVGRIIDDFLDGKNGDIIYRYDSIVASVIVAVVLMVKGVFDRRKR